MRAAHPTRRAITILLVVLACLTLRAQTPQLPHLYILSIGIDHYPTLPNFRFAQQDATAIAQAFAPTPSNVKLYDVTSTPLLNPTATEITQAIQTDARLAKPGDVFLLYFNGNGLCDLKGDYAFAATDTAITDGAPKNALSATRLAALLQQIPARRQLILLDTCDSQRAVNSLHAALQRPDSFGLDTLQRQVAVLSMDGSTTFEPNNVGHSALTYFFLKGLTGPAGDGHVTEASFEAYLKGLMPQVSAAAKIPMQLHSWSTLGPLVLSESDAHAEAMIRVELEQSSIRQTLQSYHPAHAESALSSDEQPDEDTTRGQGSRTPSGQSKLVDLGKDYALIVATDHYAPGWRTLQNPLFDARALSDELVHDYGFDPSRITLLRDAKKSDLVRTIKQFIAQKGQFGPNDRMLVYFAGHGVKDVVDGYVAFADSKPPSEDDSLDSLMNFATLSNALNTIPVPHLLLVMDVCYGGVFDARTSFHTLLGGDQDEQAPRDQLIQRMLRARSRIYLTSGDENHEVSDGKPGLHSPFSRALLRALQQRGGQSQLLDIASLYSSLRSLPMEPRAGYFDRSGAEQNADFVLIPTTPKP